MNILLVYNTRHGCAEKAALEISRLLGEHVEMVNLRQGHNFPEIDNYDTVIIGGSIHMGKVQKKVRKFMQKYRAQLFNKRLGLYLCHMYEGDMAEKQLNNAFPEELRNHAVVTGLFGGEFDFEKMNFLERKIIQKVAKVDASVSKFNNDAIERFVQKIKQ